MSLLQAICRICLVPPSLIESSRRYDRAAMDAGEASPPSFTIGASCSPLPFPLYPRIFCSSPGPPPCRTLWSKDDPVLLLYPDRSMAQTSFETLTKSEPSDCHQYACSAPSEYTCLMISLSLITSAQSVCLVCLWARFGVLELPASTLA